MPLADLTFASGESSLSVRSFRIEEAVSRNFTATVVARSPDQIDLDTLVGQGASLAIESGLAFAHEAKRTWSGVCRHAAQIRAEPTGLSTYEIVIVPSLWLLTQRRDHRVFQHLSIPDIVDRVLSRWGIDPIWRVDRGAYPKLEHKVQYGESDHAFLGRLLEEAGITFTFATGDSDDGAPIFADALHRASPRAPALPFVDSPSESSEREMVTELGLRHEVRPGGYAIRDHDFRNPAFAHLAEAQDPGAPDARLTQYHYDPGAFLIEGGSAGDTPVADDKGVARVKMEEGRARAARFLQAERTGARAVSFRTNAMDITPGLVIHIEGHPHQDLAGATGLLITEAIFEGAMGEEWTRRARAVFTDVPYRPPRLSPKPTVEGVQSATVVGPAGEEIHTDEFGRVRVELPWDREGKRDDGSSCWIRVAQGWAGTGFGIITIPRVGQEVLVGFLDGDPDLPIIVGRVFNAENVVPYKLPSHRTRSTWKSRTSPGGDGFNEIMMDDSAGGELVWVQAQKDLRKLVKHDETVTIGNDREKLVKGDEREMTGGNRDEVTGGNRVEITEGDRTTVIEAERRELVLGDAIERIEGDELRYVGGDQHLAVDGKKRELVKGDSHLTVKGDSAEKVGKTRSLQAGSHQIGTGTHAVSASKVIHLKSAAKVVIEAPDVTIKAAGGFVRVDGTGVTVNGSMVWINSGGGPGSASGGGGETPEKPEEARVDKPELRDPEDVSKTKIGDGEH